MIKINEKHWSVEFDGKNFKGTMSSPGFYWQAENDTALAFLLRLYANLPAEFKKYKKELQELLAFIKNTNQAYETAAYIASGDRRWHDYEVYEMVSNLLYDQLEDEGLEKAWSIDYQKIEDDTIEAVAEKLQDEVNWAQPNEDIYCFMDLLTAIGLETAHEIATYTACEAA